MLPGERAALEGILAVVRPTVSIEIGTDKGGSLQRISAHSEKVHAFDLVRHPKVTSDRFPNVVFHTGDSHELLAKVLAELTATGQNVDFAFIDGDHTAVGVRRDLEDLLSSSSVRRTIILIHDTLNSRVRSGLEQVDYDRFSKVQFVDLDFVQGRALRERNDLWAGLGIVVAGWDLRPDVAGPPVYSAPEIYAQRTGGARWDYAQLLELERELSVQRDVVRLMERSWSWRFTAPARRLRRSLRKGQSRDQ